MGSNHWQWATTVHPDSVPIDGEQEKEMTMTFQQIATR